MSPVIRISNSTYKKLESLAKGFDTPGNVIERLLDFFEKSSLSKNDLATEKPSEKKKRQPVKYSWTKDDDIVAFYLYRFDTDGLASSVEEIAHQREMSAASLIMRIANFKAIDGGGGLQNYAKQSQKVFLELNSLSKAEHQSEVKRILNL
jgi:hypothetical protein